MHMINRTEEPIALPTVLLVEDDWVIRVLIHDILENEAFHVVAFETADEAWTYLHQQAGNVDLIFSDIHMPGSLDGIDLANLAYRRWPHIPMILSSAVRGQQRLDSGCVPIFVPKPWHSREIGMVCRRALADRKAQRRAAAQVSDPTFSLKD